MRSLVRDFLARLESVNRLLTEEIEDSSSIVFLIANGIDDPAVPVYSAPV